MNLFDTHCHINDPKFDDDRPEVIDRMKSGGIKRAVVVGDAARDDRVVLALTEQYDFLYAAYGLHPHDASHWSVKVRTCIADTLSKPKIVALGEIGLDYHYDFSPRDEQKEAFAQQLALAYELKKPVILHIREAHGDAYDLLDTCRKRGISISGIMHCYGGSLESAIEYIRMGLYISFSGSLTFKNTPILTRVAQNIPLDRILIETDSPYMAPVPMRGHRNEPAYIRYVCEKLALIRGIAAEKIADITFENGLKVFEI